MIGGTAEHSGPARAGFLRPKAFIALVLAGLPSLALAWIPFVELKMESGTATSTANTGSAGGSATLSATTPAFVSTTAISGGAYALDFGSTDGNFYADQTSSAVLNAAKSLKSFTITGWVNCRADNTNWGGGRIVSWFKDSTGFGGVDLAYRSGGSLGLGVNQYNDHGGVLSNPSKITVDPTTSYNNWRFFAVTYDGTVSSGNVKFYFGTNNVPASLDRTLDYNRGAICANIAPSLTVGNVPSHHRAGGFYANFHGLIDQVRIYGNASNNGGVLTLDQIQSLQAAAPLVNVAGVVYDQWNGISGNSISNLTCDPRFSSNTPSTTKLQANFEGFENSGDNYGARISGWVKAPETGTYTFWIVADDAGELRVSTDANPANKRLVASVATYNSTNTSWTQYPSQQSEPVELQANQYYYVEALMKEGGGGDFVRVGWQTPSGILERPIPQARLVTTPPDAVPFYPSQYPVYEPGTYTKKASMGWQKQTDNDHFYIMTDQTEALTAKNGMTTIPQQLNFGPAGLLGIRWAHDDIKNFDYMALGTGIDGTPQFDAVKVRRTPEGVDGVEFPLGLDFPATESVDGSFTWDKSGMADETGANFYRIGTGLSTTTEETGALTSARVGFNRTLTSTEVAHEFSRQDASQLLPDELSISQTYTPLNAAPFVTTTEVHADGSRYSLSDETGPSSTTQRQASMGAQQVELIETFNSTEVGHEYKLDTRSTLDKGQLRIARTESGPHQETTVAATLIDPDKVETETIVAHNMVTTPKWRVSTQLPDYVFQEDYEMKSIEEVEAYARKHHHLPHFPSAKVMAEKGVDLTEMNMNLLRTVEELTLHLASLKKDLRRQQAEMEQLKQELKPGKKGKADIR